MRQPQRPEERKIGVHLSLDLELLGKLDAAAEHLGLSRSELVRRVIEDWDEQQAARTWVQEEAGAALAEDRVSWDQAKAELGL